MLEECGPEIKYVKGPNNDAADALSRIPSLNYDVTESESTRDQLSERYGVDQLYGDTFPLI